MVHMPIFCNAGLIDSCRKRDACDLEAIAYPQQIRKLIEQNHIIFLIIYQSASLPPIKEILTPPRPPNRGSTNHDETDEEAAEMEQLGIKILTTTGNANPY